VATTEVSADEVDCVEYRSDRLVAIVPRGHPLAERQQVKVIEMLEHNLISIAPSSTLMGHVRKTAALAGVEFKPKYSVNSIYAAMGLVRVNQGVTIQPDSLVSTQDLEWVRTVPLDEPWAQRHLILGTRHGRSLSVAAKNFVAQLTSRPG
jgi:DNA-binding transcriptional LysR family regulator